VVDAYGGPNCSQNLDRDIAVDAYGGPRRPVLGVDGGGTGQRGGATRPPNVPIQRLAGGTGQRGGATRPPVALPNRAWCVAAAAACASVMLRAHGGPTRPRWLKKYC